jgi:hypothetical protein
LFKIDVTKYLLLFRDEKDNKTSHLIPCPKVKAAKLVFRVAALMQSLIGTIIYDDTTELDYLENRETARAFIDRYHRVK